VRSKRSLSLFPVVPMGGRSAFSKIPRDAAVRHLLIVMELRGQTKRCSGERAGLSQSEAGVRATQQSNLISKT
jgi:hypothetical protein